MTSYYVLIADGPLVRQLDTVEGLRVIRPAGPGDNGHTRWWLVEDDNAPAELEQHNVEPVFTRHDDGRVTVTERHIVNSRGFRVVR